METEYSSYRLGMSRKRASWLFAWLNDKVTAGKVTAKEMQQGLGRLGFAAIALDWQRPFLGPLHAWSSAMQGEPGQLIVPTMLRVFMRWRADKLDTGEMRLHRPATLYFGGGG